MSPPERLRILMTTDAVGGVWVYATELSRALCDAGCEVTLVVMGPPPRLDQVTTLRDLPGLRLEVTDLQLEWMDPCGEDTARAREMLLGIGARVAPEVVHLNGFREASFGWAAPVLVAAHSCVWSWWKACRGGRPDDRHWDRYAEAVAAGLESADRWVAPSQALRNEVQTTYRPTTAGRVIWNGLNSPGASPHKQPFILTAGRLWDEAKNLAALAAVAADLDWPVRAAGPMQPPDSADAFRPDQQMTWLGALTRPQLLDEMQRAGVFVAPALYEPFGLTILEAAAAGCALVLSGIPSLRELWSGAAMFVEPRDPDSLRGALQSLCRNDELRLHFQQAARLRSQTFSRQTMSDAYRALYREMVTPRAEKLMTRPARRLELHA